MLTGERKKERKERTEQRKLTERDAVGHNHDLVNDEQENYEVPYLAVRALRVDDPRAMRVRGLVCLFQLARCLNLDPSLLFRSRDLDLKALRGSVRRRRAKDVRSGTCSFLGDLPGLQVPSKEWRA